MGSDLKVHTISAPQQNQYGIYSGWDIYHSLTELQATLDPQADARIAGFEAEMKAKFPGVKLLPEQNDDADSVGTATSFIEGDITANPGLTGAFAANVITAEGAASGIVHAGKTGKVKLATFDADATQMTMMRAGTIQLAIAQEPALEGADGVEQALNAIEGKPVTKNIATQLIAVTSSNMNGARIKPYIYASSCS
jgi:ribose transport system substrate-binding protein